MIVSKSRMAANVKLALEQRLKEFTKTILVEEETQTPDGQGGFAKAWSTFASIDNVLVVPMDTSKMILDDHIKSKEVKRFEFQYLPGLNNNMRINYNGSIYNIMPDKSVIDSDVFVKIVGWEGFAT